MIVKAIFEHETGFREHMIFDYKNRNQIRVFAEYANHVIANRGMVTTMLAHAEITFPMRIPCED